MPTLVINDDNNNKVSYPLLDATTTSMSNDSLLLTLKTPKSTFEYLISTDLREPKIDLINEFITNRILVARNNNTPLTVSEYLVRNYIYIGNIDIEEMKQFTANKR